MKHPYMLPWNTHCLVPTGMGMAWIGRRRLGAQENPEHKNLRSQSRRQPQPAVAGTRVRHFWSFAPEQAITSSRRTPHWNPLKQNIANIMVYHGEKRCKKCKQTPLWMIRVILVMSMSPSLQSCRYQALTRQKATLEQKRRELAKVQTEIQEVQQVRRAGVGGKYEEFWRVDNEGANDSKCDQRWKHVIPRHSDSILTQSRCRAYLRRLQHNCVMETLGPRWRTGMRRQWEEALIRLWKGWSGREW